MTLQTVVELKAGDLVSGEHGESEILSIVDAEWRFSRKPKRTIEFRARRDGFEYTRSYHPDHPIENNLGLEATSNAY